MILVLAPLPPLRTGIAIYSQKLYSEVGKRISVSIIANKGAKSEQFKVIETWKFESVFSIFHIIKEVCRNRRRVVHMQLGYTLIRDPIYTQIATIILLLILKILKTKTIITLHGVITKETLRGYLNTKKGLQKFLISLVHGAYIIYYKLLLHLSDIIIVHNNLIKDKLIALANFQNKNKVVVIPHGVDIPPERRELKKEEKLNILFTGFIRKTKGIEDFLKALEILRKRKKSNFKVTIAGAIHIRDDVNYYRRIRELAKKYRLHDIVEFKVRFIPEEELQEIIHKADIIVLPYKDFFYEASGVLARLMGYGKAIICTNIPKFAAELKHGKDAIIVPVGNPVVLADAIYQLMTNSRLRERLGLNLKGKAKDRMWGKIAERHIVVYYKSLLN